MHTLWQNKGVKSAFLIYLVKWFLMFKVYLNFVVNSVLIQISEKIIIPQVTFLDKILIQILFWKLINILMNSCQDIEKFVSLFCENLYRILKRSLKDLYMLQEFFYDNKIIKILMGSLKKNISRKFYISCNHKWILPSSHEIKSKINYFKIIWVLNSKII